jgi:CRISPR-associated protein Cas6
MHAFVDLSFPLVGKTLPLDHGYSLYAALSRILPRLHEHKAVGVHPIRGDAAGDGLLRVAVRSQLQIRTPTDLIAEFLPLAGKVLNLDGHSLRVGVPRVLALRSAASLAARLVTIKGFTDPAGFLEAVRRQLDALGVSRQTAVEIPSAPAGRAHAGEPLRRVLRIKDRTVVGFAVHVLHLGAEESVMLQEHGLGGRRHMGCGIFVPVEKKQ